jgi:GMP synthase (glutamine-hydrolysing)
MIYLVDNTIDGQGGSPRELNSVLRRMLLGVEIQMEPFASVTMKRIEKLRPSHIILSGQSPPWNMYSTSSLAGIFGVIRQATQPILGVCGGHQQIALALGGTVGLMQRLEPGEGYEGAKRERGFLPVDNNRKGIFEGLPNSITVWHSHCDEVKEMPSGFQRTAWNDTCSIQAMSHTRRPIFGVQFHPELFDSDHPQGRRILENFRAL